MSYIGEEPKIFQPLEILAKRPIPKNKQGVQIKMKNIGEDENISEEVKENDEIGEPTPIIEKKRVKINDKRKENLINRNAVLEKIKANRNVINKTNIEEPKETDIREELPIAEEKMIQIIEEPAEEKKEEEEETIIQPKRTIIIKPKLNEKEKEEIGEPVPKPIQKKLKIVEKLTEKAEDVDLTKVVIRTQKVADRLPKEREKMIVKASSYYMNNRKIFIQKMANLFKPYMKEIMDAEENVSCENRNLTTDFDLLTHQKVVRDYLNLYTPYRGLLLYHGLGSGKTCTSIAIAEGMKSGKKIFILTPASLKVNFFSELKKCGDEIYRKNQFWEFISIEGKPEMVNILAKSLSLSTAYIRAHGGAWLVNVNKEPNFDQLEPKEQESLDNQLNEMIRSKYHDENYNGLNEKRMKILTGNNTINPFDNTVVVIDEAHNFVSRIVNKINDKKSLSYRLYDYIMKAKNAKIVLLTGTPIINYPNEIGVLFNLLRGYIYSWTIPIQWEKKEKMDANKIVSMFENPKYRFKTFDNVEYSNNKITITKNPFGFINTKKRGVAKGETKKKGGKNKKKLSAKLRSHGKKKLKFDEEEITEEEREAQYKMDDHGGDDRYFGGNLSSKYNGVKLDDTGNITNEKFLEKILYILKDNEVRVLDKQITIEQHKALPDVGKVFNQEFVDADNDEAKNLNLLQRRIIGLTSYFRSAQEDLLPSFVKTEEGDNYHVVRTEMSDQQFSEYEKIRKVEYERDKKAKRAETKKKKDDLFEISSTYRVFSRSACNFVFPGSIERPVPNMDEDDVDEDDLDGVNTNESDINVESVEEGMIPEEEMINPMDNEAVKYAKRRTKALNELNKEEYIGKDNLMKYSPKFAKILENLSDPENEGLHLVYSHFRTMEGIEILKMILLKNGFAEFKIKKSGEAWTMVENEEDEDKPKFVLYTGTETAEEKEIIRNIYNSKWEFVPSTISEKLKMKSENNNYGDIIKIIMITASGAEGINLRSTRFVHVVEPYWHMVRVEQVVGRARRICSHEDLPTNMRNVKVFLYVSVLSDEQKKDEKHIELIIRDVSRVDSSKTITTDEKLYEISSLKQKINNQILNAMKETAIDCNLYSGSNNKEGEELVCYGFGKVESNAFSSYPTFERDKLEKEVDVNKKMWQGQIITRNGVQYALNTENNEVYDYNDYMNARKQNIPLNVGPIGKLKKVNNDYVIESV